MNGRIASSSKRTELTGSGEWVSWLVLLQFSHKLSQGMQLCQHTISMVSHPPSSGNCFLGQCMEMEIWMETKQSFLHWEVVKRVFLYIGNFFWDWRWNLVFSLALFYMNEFDEIWAGVEISIQPFFYLIFIFTILQFWLYVGWRRFKVVR